MYVYFIQCGNDRKPPIKIGVAKNINRRMEQMQTGNPYPLKVIASIECANRKEAYNLEAYIHQKLAKRKIRGEWFTTCMKRVNKIVGNWYTNKELDRDSYYQESIDRELDIAHLANLNDNYI